MGRKKRRIFLANLEKLNSSNNSSELIPITEGVVAEEVAPVVTPVTEPVKTQSKVPVAKKVK